MFKHYNVLYIEVVKETMFCVNIEDDIEESIVLNLCVKQTSLVKQLVSSEEKNKRLVHSIKNLVIVKSIKPKIELFCYKAFFEASWFNMKMQ